MGHSHGHAGHNHGEENLSDRQLIFAVAINVLLTVAQIIGGIVSGSLALIADALHNFSDAAALGLAWFARKIGRRPADKLMTFGYAQGEVVAALINLTTLLIIGFYLLVEAINRFADPQPVEGWTVIGVAGIALVIDLVTAFIVYRGSHDSINMKAAFLHNVSDALGVAAVVFALALWLVRSQTTIDDEEYMAAMIPHHSIAIMTSERAHIRDPRVRKLAHDIILAQRREIAQMKYLIEDIEENGVRTTERLPEGIEAPVPASPQPDPTLAETPDEGAAQ